MCAKQAWRFLQGGSPCQVRHNQPPVPSLASLKEARKEGRRRAERQARSVDREPCRPQGRPRSPKPGTAPKGKVRTATRYVAWKPTRRDRHGEIPEVRRGHQGVACMERSVRNLGDLGGSSATDPERHGMRRLRHARGNPDTGLGRSLRRAGRRTIQETMSEEVGRCSREARPADGFRGVGSAHSTRRAGEPPTGGRG